jgi:uncharacterized membrane protein
METPSSLLHLRHFGVALAKFVLAGIVLPLIPVVFLGQPLAATLALMTSTFILEYGAAPVGIGLGLNPVFVLFVLLCIAVAVTILLFDIFSLIGTRSARVAAFLEKASERANRSKIISKYGIYGLIPCVWTLGFYACPPVSWVLGWDRTRSIIVIMAGEAIASVIAILASIGIIRIFFP